MTVTLIGLPSSGKSTLGVLLAKALGYSFVDTDILLQEHSGRLLHEMISELGTEDFIRLESSVNLTVKGGNAVIATGGSAVYGSEAMEHFKALGKVVYIKIPYETLVERLGDYSHRGIVLRNGMTLRDMYDERIPLYEKYADITVESSDTLHGTVKKLIDILKG